MDAVNSPSGVPGFEDPFHIEGDLAADGLGERDEFVGGVDAMHRVAVRGRIGEDVEARVLAVDDDADGDAGPGVGRPCAADGPHSEALSSSLPRSCNWAWCKSCRESASGCPAVQRTT